MMIDLNELMIRVFSWRFIMFTLLSFVFPFTYITLYKLLQKKGMPLWKKEPSRSSSKNEH